MMQIHAANGLPANCFPELVIKDETTGRTVPNPLFLVKEVVEHDGLPVMGGFLRATCEAYLILDHEAGTPEQRWEWLQELTKTVSEKAWARGLDEITVWVPDELIPSFEKRLLDLKFLRSPWQSYTLQLAKIVVPVGVKS
jgi:hypothetical protein